MQTTPNLTAIVQEAQQAAYTAADKFFKEKLGGRDQFACGFAWVQIFKYNDKLLDGRSAIAKELKKVGISQNYNRVFEMWNPSGYHCQNVDTLEEGARAAAEVFRKYGFTAYAGSRLD
jgi:hypothetical protein